MHDVWIEKNQKKKNKKKKTELNSDINDNDVEEEEDQCYDDDFEEDEDITPNIGDSSNNLFALAEEHPSHKYMALHKRKNIAVPQINVKKLLPNTKDLVMHEPSTSQMKSFLNVNNMQKLHCYSSIRLECILILLLTILIGKNIMI